MIILTYWADAAHRRTPDDFDEIREVLVKRVAEIPTLIAQRPAHCTMISTEHSAERTLRSGKRTNFWKEIWRGDRQQRCCPTCGRRY